MYADFKISKQYFNIYQYRKSNWNLTEKITTCKHLYLYIQAHLQRKKNMVECIPWQRPSNIVLAVSVNECIVGIKSHSLIQHLVKNCDPN